MSKKRINSEAPVLSVDAIFRSAKTAKIADLTYQIERKNLEGYF